MEEIKLSYEEVIEKIKDIVDNITNRSLLTLTKSNLNSSEVVNNFLKFYPIEKRMVFTDFDYITEVEKYKPIGSFSNLYSAVARDFKENIMFQLLSNDTKISVDNLLVYIIKHLAYQLLGQTKYDYSGSWRQKENPLPLLKPYFLYMPSSINDYCPYRKTFSVIDISDEVYKELSDKSNLEGYVEVYSNIIVDYLLNVTIHIYLDDLKFDIIRQRMRLL